MVLEIYCIQKWVQSQSCGSRYIYRTTKQNPKEQVQKTIIQLSSNTIDYRIMYSLILLCLPLSVMGDSSCEASVCRAVESNGEALLVSNTILRLCGTSNEEIFLRQAGKKWDAAPIGCALKVGGFA